MEDIHKLIEAAQKGDKEALETLVSENSGLIWSAAKRFAGQRNRIR